MYTMTAKELQALLRDACDKSSALVMQLDQLSRAVHGLGPSEEIKHAIGRSNGSVGHLAERLYTWLDAADVAALNERNREEAE